MEIAVILPAYNEELTIERTVEEFARHLPEATIYVIDNRSQDRTGALAREAIVRAGVKGAVIYEARPGKAFAVQRAFADIEADIFVLSDADLTYPANEVRKLIQPVADGYADMVVGDRRRRGDYQRENKRPFHNVGNSLVKNLVNILFNAKLNDILSGYRVFSRRFVKNYPVLSKGFAIEAEMTIHALDKGFSVVEIPIEYKDRPSGSFSKLRTYSDGSKVVKLILEIFKNYRPLSFFGVVSSLFFIAGLGAGYPVIDEYFRTGVILHIPFAILATGLMVLALLALSIGVILDTVAANNRFHYQLKLIDHPHPVTIIDNAQRKVVGGSDARRTN